MSVDRFEFEQLFMECWGITSDISEISKFVCDSADVSVETHDKIANMLIGLEQLYEIRFSRLFEMFEEMVKQKQL